MTHERTTSRRENATRRQFLATASAAALGAFAPRTSPPAFAAAQVPGFDPGTIPSADEMWALLEEMNALGPRLAGNAAHRKYVDILEDDMKEAGLQTRRDTYTFPRWEAGTWRLATSSSGGRTLEIPVTFYYPHSGQTGPQGVTGPLVYAGRFVSDGSSQPNRSGDFAGKIVFVEYEIAARDYNDWYQPWGYYTPDSRLEKYVSSVMAQPFEDLTAYKEAGAAGVVIGWTNLSDDQASRQNWPFGRPLQQLPALLVGPTAGKTLRELAAAGATATLTLDATVFPDSRTDSLLATLPGSSPDEILIINTHTDGPNAIQENAGVALTVLARYFSKLPRDSRRRTLVFSLATGHDVGAYVPGRQGGFAERHPDLVKKSIASVAIEHLGCREWRDDGGHTRYTATGRDELTYAITHHELVAKIALECVAGTPERHLAAVRPLPKGRYLGVGGRLAATGMPTLGYYASPTYLNMMAPDGCLSKLSKPLMHGQIVALAKMIHRLDSTPAGDLAWLPAASGRGPVAGPD